MNIRVVTAVDVAMLLLDFRPYGIIFVAVCVFNT